MNLVSPFDLDSFVPSVIQGWEPSQRSVIIPIAGCIETTCTVMYRCHLVPANEIQLGCWEFVFDLHVDWLDGSNEPFNTMDRNIAYNYVPKSVWPMIMPAVCKCIDALVSECEPEWIYRVTKKRNLPEKALEKHYMICRRFEGLGYNVAETGVDPAGRVYWLMSR